MTHFEMRINWRKQLKQKTCSPLLFIFLTVHFSLCSLLHHILQNIIQSAYTHTTHPTSNVPIWLEAIITTATVAVKELCFAVFRGKQIHFILISHQIMRLMLVLLFYFFFSSSYVIIITALANFNNACSLCSTVPYFGVSFHFSCAVCLYEFQTFRLIIVFFFC